MSEGVIQYKTLIYASPDLLDDSVNRYIEEGWEPHGSPYIYPVGGRLEPLFCQAMVKKTTYYGGIGGGR